MTKTEKCCECGEDFEFDVNETQRKANEFDEVLDRIMMMRPTCGACAEKAQKKREEDAAREKAERASADLKKWECAFTETVGRKYLACSFETFRAGSPSQRAALTAAREFSVSPTGMIYFHGKPGTGKTHLAVSIFREHAKEPRWYNPNTFDREDGFRDVDFWTVPELLIHLRAQMMGDGTEERAITPLLKSRLLILDDLGAEKMTDWVRQAFYVVISRRERDELPTVITSNLSLGEIEARVGDERITSRIGGAAKIIRVEGADQRLLGRGRQ